MPAEPLDGVDLGRPDTFTTGGIDVYWQRRRAAQPVHRHPATSAGPAFWVLARYRDVLALYQDHERFSSYSGNMLPSLHKSGGDPAAGMTLALMDPPRHTAMRAMVLRSLTPRTRGYIVHQLQYRVDKLIAAARELGECDFAAEVARQIPTATICDLIGVPAADHARVLGWSIAAMTPDDDADVDGQMWAARNELLAYCADLADERREEPRDDLMSALVAGSVDGEPLSDDEVMLNVYGLLLAGDHTSRLAMTGAAQALGAHPAQWAALKAGEVGLDVAVEEVLRWSTPMMHVGRTATADAEIGGELIRAGEIVTGWNYSANRDPEAFADPDVFDLSRSPNKHLALGYGQHFCLGSYLGRAEVAAVLRALRATVTTIEPAGPPARIRSTVLQGFRALPLRLG